MKIKLLIAFICAIVIAAATLYTGYHFLNASPSQNSKSRNYTVEKGSTIRSIAEDLEKEGLIKNADFFVALSYIQKKKQLLKGTYTIHSSSSCSDILSKLAKGEIVTVSVTIPEGSNIYDIAEALKASGICDNKRFLFYVKNRQFLQSIGIDSPTAEGYLFPDTYSFAPESDERDVILHLFNVMKKHLSSLDVPASLPEGMNIHKLLIMASLVEKEAKFTSEQTLVSSVFHNRIKRGMRFDSDPTVRYAVKKFKGRIRYKDLDSNSPFNTYRHVGYPPTPIASPGLGALKAALKPEPSSYLYFVARNDGSHYFSKSLSRHNKAVEYYQKNMANGFVDEQR